MAKTSGGDRGEFGDRGGDGAAVPRARLGCRGRRPPRRPARGARRRDRRATSSSPTSPTRPTSTRCATTSRRLGPVHALVNNAGGAFGLGHASRTSDAGGLARMFEVNVSRVKRVTSALLPLLRARRAADGGHADILTVTSIAGHVAYEGGGGYNAAKFAAHALIAVLRLELAGEPIRVLEVAPGMVQDRRVLARALRRRPGEGRRRLRRRAGPARAPRTSPRRSCTRSSCPAHVNLDLVTIKPVAQAAPHKVIRGPLAPEAASPRRSSASRRSRGSASSSAVDVGERELGHEEQQHGRDERADAADRPDRSCSRRGWPPSAGQPCTAPIASTIAEDRRGERAADRLRRVGEAGGDAGLPARGGGGRGGGQRADERAASRARR